MDLHLEEMMGLDEDVRVAYLKAFSRLAGADGNFDDNEKAFIRDLARQYGISAQRTGEIFEVSDDDEIVNGVKIIKSRRVALALLRDLCILAHSDDELSDAEVLLIGRIGQAMNISLDKIEQISNWVIDKIILTEEAKIIFEEI